MNEAKIFRILDANFNRSREGLRVCEEVARFVMEDPSLTRALKEARHAVSGILKKSPDKNFKLLASRDVKMDVGKGSSVLESSRGGFYDLFIANLQRTKESLRVLEELAKTLDPQDPAKFKRVRFNIYDIEKRALPKLEALSRHGSKRLKK